MPDREHVSTEAPSAFIRVRNTHTPNRVGELRESAVAAIAERARGGPCRRVVPAPFLALQRDAGNHAVATWLQRADPPAGTTPAAISDAQIEQLVAAVDKIQQELVRVEQRSVTMTDISMYYTTWMDCVNTVVAQERKAMEDVPPNLALTVLLGAFSLLAGPMAGKVVGVLGERLASIGGGVEALIRAKAIDIAAGGPRAVAPSQEEIAAVVITVKGKLQAKWKSIEEEAGKADISALLPKPTGVAPETIDGMAETMKQSGRVASKQAVDSTGNMTPAQLISLSRALDPTKVPRDVIQGKIRKELRTLIDVAKAQGKPENKTFRINAWGSTGVAILQYKGLSLVASQKASFRFVRWLPPGIVEAQGGAQKFELFDVDAHRGPNVGASDGVFVGFLPPPTFAQPYMAMINEYGAPRPALVQDVGTESHFVRWVPPDESEYENAVAGGAAKSFEHGQVKGVKPLTYTPDVR